MRFPSSVWRGLSIWALWPFHVPGAPLKAPRPFKRSAPPWEAESACLEAHPAVFWGFFFPLWSIDLSLCISLCFCLGPFHLLRGCEDGDKARDSWKSPKGRGPPSPLGNRPSCDFKSSWDQAGWKKLSTWLLSAMVGWFCQRTNTLRSLFSSEKLLLTHLLCLLFLRFYPSQSNFSCTNIGLHSHFHTHFTYFSAFVYCRPNDRSFYGGFSPVKPQ